MATVLAAGNAYKILVERVLNREIAQGATGVVTFPDVENTIHNPPAANFVAQRLAALAAAASSAETELKRPLAKKKPTPPVNYPLAPAMNPQHCNNIQSAINSLRLLQEVNVGDTLEVLYEGMRALIDAVGKHEASEGFIDGYRKGWDEMKNRCNAPAPKPPTGNAARNAAANAALPVWLAAHGWSLHQSY
jgi:hypothetical protein